MAHALFPTHRTRTALLTATEVPGERGDPGNPWRGNGMTSHRSAVRRGRPLEPQWRHLELIHFGTGCRSAPFGVVPPRGSQDRIPDVPAIGNCSRSLVVGERFRRLVERSGPGTAEFVGTTVRGRSTSLRCPARDIC